MTNILSWKKVTAPWTRVREMVAVTALIPYWAPQHAKKGHQFSV